MKQKIVIQVPMTNHKQRTKAMKIAATTYGVISTAIEGPNKDQLVVIGEDIDSAQLVRSLRKHLLARICCFCWNFRFSHAEILKVEEVKKEEQKKPPEPCCQPLPVYPQYSPIFYPVSSHPDPSGCAVM